MATGRRRKQERKSKETSLFGEPDVVVLPREKPEGHSTREVVSAIVRSAWAAAQEWTVAWKSGVSHLKSVVEALVATRQDDQLDHHVHISAQQLHEAIAKMQSRVRTLDELLEQLQKVKRIHREDSDQQLFSTLTFQHIVSVLESVCEDYRKETEVKVGACSSLPLTNSSDTLNTSVTLWTHHIHIVTHHYPLKLLLRETQQL